MRIALVYTGQERTWARCKENHELNVWNENTTVFWHTVEALGIPGDYYTLDGHSHPYDKNRRPETVVASSLNQWHNNFVGFSIVPKGFDVYVRIRPDIIFTGKLEYNQNYEGLKVYIPQGHNYWDGVNDQIAWGNYETMKVYYSIYVKHLEIFHSGLEFHTERYLTENLKRQGVEIIRVPVDNHIIR